MDKLSGLASKLGGRSSSGSSDPNQQAGNANNEDYLDKGKLWRTSTMSLLCMLTNPSQPWTALSASTVAARSTP